MNEKLNKDYFKTKKKHQENYKNRKRLKRKKVLINLILAIVLIVLYDVLFKKCQNNIKENQKEYELKEPVSSCL